MKENPIVKALPWLIVAMAVILLLYHIFHGRNRLEHELSGRKVKRWNGFERVVHWITAITFIILAITGLSMLFGKAMLGWGLSKAAFAAWAQIALQTHNLLGPVFSVGILLMIVMWIWHNFPTVTDLKWFAQGGGLYLRNNHVGTADGLDLAGGNDGQIYYSAIQSVPWHPRCDLDSGCTRSHLYWYCRH